MRSRTTSRVPADVSIGDPGAAKLLAPGSDAQVWHLLHAPKGMGW
ncbi:MAG TPA: hypothetical protein VK402_22090 [Blastococcus sp.]|nr:hypothetical protein [Blastococcus sp.]